MATDADTTPTDQTLFRENDGLTPGAVLVDRYRVERCLASGGYGDVWAARDLEDDRRVAIKILRTDAGNNDPSAIARMRQEAEILKAINHPHIVEVYRFDSSPHGEFLAMELLEGLAIDQLLQAEGPAEAERVAPIAMQLLSALDLAHSKSILHRDIKPENIILCRDLQGREIAKLVDFGIAKAQKILSDTDSGFTLVQTRSGGFIGTPRYAAPEQAVGDPMGPNIDLFSLGLVLAEWLTGKQRLDAERHADVMTQLLSPSELDVSDCPYAWQAWLKKMVEKNPRDRFQSAEEALHAFQKMVIEAHQRPDFLDDNHLMPPTPGFASDAPRGSFIHSEAPLELDYDRVRTLEEQKRPYMTTPAGLSPEVAAQSPELAPPSAAQSHEALRARPLPPLEEFAREESEGDDLLTTIVLFLAIIVVSMGVVFALIMFLRD